MEAANRADNIDIVKVLLLNRIEILLLDRRFFDSRNDSSFSGFDLFAEFASVAKKKHH